MGEICNCLLSFGKITDGTTPHLELDSINMKHIPFFAYA